MLNKLRTALGVGAVTTIAAAGLIALPTEASAGVGCSTVGDNTPVHADPWSTAPITNRLAPGTELNCSGGPGWFRVARDGQWIGYINASFLDTSAG